jgi:4-hydroxybenzoate polyprenyltransferase
MNGVLNRARILAAALRIYQWPKNLLAFAALVFAEQLHDPTQVLRSVFAFFILCAASSAIYLFNDLMDMDKDRAHPEKCRRPLASGAMSIPVAMVLMILLVVGSLGFSLLLNGPFFGAVVVYLLLTAAYTLKLKHVLLLDVMAVALGFVIRAIAGALALDVVFSNWLVVCTLFLALFLSLGKRRHELELLESNAGSHREVLDGYSIPFIDMLIVLVAGSTLISYTIYTCSTEVVERLGTDKLYVTIPFVVYGLFRYLHLVHHKRGGGDPSRALLKDWPLGLTVLLWGLACVIIMYTGRSFPA